MKASIFATLGALAIATTALAGSYGEWFDRVDANADGFLSAEELGEKANHKLDKMDSNGDRLISREELDAYKAAKEHRKGNAG